jgi:hypothetical protein
MRIQNCHAETWHAADARLGWWGPDGARRLVVATADPAALPAKRPRRRPVGTVLAAGIARGARLAFPWIALQRWWQAWSKAPRPRRCKP